MQAVIINGSPRAKGITAAILHQIESELIRNGVETAYYDLNSLQISPCTGCCSCYKTGHCYMKDDAEILSEQISRCDGLVIGSPTYASNVSGTMKQFIDRGHFAIEQLLHDKFCITVSTGENYGYKDTLKILNRLVYKRSHALLKEQLEEYLLMKQVWEQVLQYMQKQNVFFPIMFFKKRHMMFPNIKSTCLF